MADDLRPAGWGTGVPQPLGTLQRERSPFWLVVGVVLIAAGVVGMVPSIVQMASTAGVDEEDVVAEGVVSALGDDGGGEPATFTAGRADPFTVWLETDGIIEENHRENVVAATACQAELADGGTPDFQGNRQGQAVTVNDDSTVGWFTAAEGEVVVRCHQEPFGQRRTRSWLEDEHDFRVVRGKPEAPWASFTVLSAGIVALLLGIWALARWHRGRVRIGQAVVG